MGLRAQAEAALSMAIENTNLFGQPITLTAPNGVTFDTVGLGADIAQAIDPQTGVVVSGRMVTVALRLSSLAASTLPSIPEGVASVTSKPWLVTVLDILGIERIFKVRESRPDRALGVLVLVLEAYRAS